MYFHEVGWSGGVVWVDLACESDIEPSGLIKYREFLDWLRNC
jgi:hypothetical protein